MRVLIFGGTGMVGQGVLRECLNDGRVTEVVTVGRSATGQRNAKLRELVNADIAAATDGLTGFDACFFCLGTSAVGMNEADYRRVTYDLTMTVARALTPSNPDMVFVYVSGAGTDAGSRMMWARVKAETEAAVLALPWRAYAMRPGFIQPMHGVRSKTGWYRAIYAVAGPLYPVLKRLFPRSVTSTEQVGQAMLRLAESGWSERVIEGADINALAAAR